MSPVIKMSQNVKVEEKSDRTTNQVAAAENTNDKTANEQAPRARAPARQCAALIWMKIKHKRLNDKLVDKRKMIASLEKENSKLQEELRRTKNMNDSLLPLAAENLSLKADLHLCKVDLEGINNEKNHLHKLLTEAAGDIKGEDEESLDGIYI